MATKTTKLGRAKKTLSMEKLEGRTLPAVLLGLSGGVLSIDGDSWHNSATVNLANSGRSIVVEVSSTPSSGFSLVPSVVSKTFSAGSVSSVKFWGYGGDDSFVLNVSIPSTAYGGSGRDYLEGANAADVFFGGTENDTLVGYGGNDDLYGEGGDDILKGMSGLDGLYGGAGADQLYGGSGADRFLVMSGSSEHKDAAAEDALLIFKNGAKTWNETEIRDMDGGLKLLHRRTGNDNLLETSTGGKITFIRGGNKGSTLADNPGNGTINMYDGSFSSATMAAVTTIHEIGHNWDTEHSNWSKWQGLSGWRTTAPPSSVASQYAKSSDGAWWYLKSGSFARSYGKTNPREDWSTAWESYFTYREGMSNVLGVSRLTTAKTAHLDAFFASLS